MTKAKKIGIILIIVGFFIPSVLYPFTSYSPEKIITKQLILERGGLGYKPRISDLEIVLSGSFVDKDKIALPYHYVIAFGIVLIFIGISVVALAGREKANAQL